jgi:hypothetical protein
MDNPSGQQVRFVDAASRPISAKAARKRANNKVDNHSGVFFQFRLSRPPVNIGRLEEWGLAPQDAVPVLILLDAHT